MEDLYGILFGHSKTNLVEIERPAQMARLGRDPHDATVWAGASIGTR